MEDKYQQKIDNGIIYDEDLILRFGLLGSKWNKTNLTYYIYNTSTHLTAAQRESVIQTAFNTWQNVSFLSFTQVSNPSNADIKLKWATGNHGDGANNAFDGSGGVLAHAFAPPPGGGTYSGEVHFDDAENWTMDQSGYNLLSVAIHEIGHALGIAHSDVPGSIMNPNYTGLTALAVDDIEAIWSLYGKPNISGYNYMPCSGAVGYSLPAAITSATWSVSSNLQIASGQGTRSITVTRSGSGSTTSGTITANIGGATVTLNVNLNLSVTSISGSTNVKTGQGIDYVANPDPAIPSNIGQYQWAVSPSSATIIQGFNSNDRIIYFISTGTYTVKVRVVTPCNTDPAYTTLTVNASS
jgi:predicted Zn-dependent protease